MCWWKLWLSWDCCEDCCFGFVSVGAFDVVDDDDDDAAAADDDDDDDDDDDISDVAIVAVGLNLLLVLVVLL